MLEGGALSDEKFPEWSKSVVLFCHITSQVAGEKYPKLLSEKGGRGFPTLAFLDAAGDVVARHDGDRTVDLFEATAASGRSFIDLRTKAAAGDKDAKIDYELARLALDAETVKFDDAKKRVADLGELGGAARKKADALLTDIEAMDIMSGISKGRPAAVKRAYDMRKAGRTPSERVGLGFWYLVMEGSEAASDAATYEEALGVVKARTFQRYEETLKKLKEKK
jgi:hypothetical protein